VALSDDKHPQAEVTFGGKNENRLPELIDAEEFIAKKGIQAKGKKVSQYDVKTVVFTEPLHKPEDDIKPEESEAENQAGEIDNSEVEDPIDLDQPEDDIQLSLF
jgi:topoisomerase-4 subunit A